MFYPFKVSQNEPCTIKVVGKDRLQSIGINLESSNGLNGPYTTTACHALQAKPLF